MKIIKTIIFLDGHGITNQRMVLLNYKYYFLCNLGETVNSGMFDNTITQCLVDNNATSISNNELIPINNPIKEHILYPLIGSQLSHGMNLRKAINELNLTQYKVQQIELVCNFDNTDYRIFLQYTNVPSENEQDYRFVQVRLKGFKASINLSVIDKFIMPIFYTQSEITNDLITAKCSSTYQEYTPVLESDGTELAQIDIGNYYKPIGIWGACRNYDGEDAFV